MIRYYVLAFAVTALAVPHSCTPHFPGVKFSPNSINFSPQLVDPGGAPSAPQKVTLTNSGTANLTITKIESSGDFSQTNDCPINTGIVPVGTCTIQITFTPNVVGNIVGAVTITDNAFGSPHVLALSGAGTAPVGFSPGSLDFGTVALNTLSTPQTVTVTNNQSIALNISSISATGDYTPVPNNCASLQPGKTCSIAVSFRPTTAGAVPGALTLATDAPLGTQPVALTGAGFGSITSNVTLSASTLAFGNQEAGTASEGKTVILSNTGNTSLSIQSISVSAEYQSTNTCGTLVSAGASCEITVKFTPSANLANVDYPGAITITNSDSTSPQVVGLSGTGAQPITSSPAAVDFGTIDANTTATDRSVTIFNNHSAAEGVSIGTSGHFDLSNNGCTQSLAPGSHCSTKVGLSSAPSQTGTISGAMTISGSSGGFLIPTVVGLSACATTVAVYPRSFNFGALSVGTISGPETTTLTNNGGDLNISAISLTGANSADYEISNNTCGAMLPGGASCTLGITYKPSATGARNAALSIADDGACSPQQEVLQGGSSAGPFTVYSTNTGSGTGIVASKPSGLTNCGSTCAATFPAGTPVTLTATPDSNSRFSGWSGACTGTPPCVLDMNSDKQVTANFTANPSLSVQFGGNGTGKVTSSPAGIDCPANQCAAQFAPATAITLTASTDTVSTFTGWSGGGCSGIGKCTMTLNSDQTVTATFIAPDFAVSASPLAPNAVPAGKSAISTVALTSSDGFNSAVALTCSVDPAPPVAPTCSLNPTSATLPGNGSLNSTLTISTTAPTTASARPSIDPFYPLSLPLLGIAWLAFEVSARKRKIALREWAFCSVLLAGMALVVSCGDGTKTTTTQQRVGGTPAGPYTITVTGSSGSTQHSSTTTLTVQ